MMNSPTKKISRPQSISRYTFLGSTVRVISNRAAPMAAIIAGGTPARNPASTTISTTTGFFRMAPCRNSGG